MKNQNDTEKVLKKIENIKFKGNDDIEKHDKKKVLSKKTKFALTIILSAFVGALNGLFGGGGGMLVVPILTILCNLSEQKAHSSAILTILPLSITSGIIYLIRGDFVFSSGGWVSAGVILGGIIGTFVMKKLSNNTLAVIFYGVMIFAGISMLVTKL